MKIIESMKRNMNTRTVTSSLRELRMTTFFPFISSLGCICLGDDCLLFPSGNVDLSLFSNTCLSDKLLILLLSLSSAFRNIGTSVLDSIYLYSGIIGCPWKQYIGAYFKVKLQNLPRYANSPCYLNVLLEFMNHQHKKYVYRLELLLFCKKKLHNVRVHKTHVSRTLSSFFWWSLPIREYSNLFI